MRALIIVVIAYLIGSIPFGYLIVRFKEGSDVRQTGSGGTGATNVSRRAGKAAGIITLLLDALKGAFAVLIAARLVEPSSPYADWTIAVAAIIVIIGHIFPVWLRFRGGKGVATGMGVFFVVAPHVVVFGALIFIVTFALTRYVSLASMVSIASIPITLSVVSIVVPGWNPESERLFAIVAIACAALITFAHRANIRRLIDGTEPKYR